jgi:hypothetical protein
MKGKASFAVAPTRDSSQLRAIVRPRCRRTFRFSSVRSRAATVSAVLRSSISRSLTTTRYCSGSPSTASSRSWLTSAREALSSGPGEGSTGFMRSSPSSSESFSCGLRLRLRTRVSASCTAIRVSQVGNGARPYELVQMLICPHVGVLHYVFRLGVAAQNALIVTARRVDVSGDLAGDTLESDINQTALIWGSPRRCAPGNSLPGANLAPDPPSPSPCR